MKNLSIANHSLALTNSKSLCGT